MPRATLELLRSRLPSTAVFLMYGLTEAFRSTFLPPDQVSIRPDSIGKAIPNAEVLVVREDGSLCASGEPGELVHRGVLVSMGYWNDHEKTTERFRPAPSRHSALTVPELAVWSGDTVRMDEEGFLYFIGRRDEMIKTSGYRVSPMEVEEVIYATELVAEAAAVGVPHPVLGQAIALIATPRAGIATDEQALLSACKRHLPAYMLPSRIVFKQGNLPRNPNGKIDRKLLAQELQDAFMETGMSDPRPKHAAMLQFPVRDDCLQIGGIPLTRLAQRIGRTPFYAYDQTGLLLIASHCCASACPKRFTFITP